MNLKSYYNLDMEQVILFIFSPDSFGPYGKVYKVAKSTINTMDSPS